MNTLPMVIAVGAVIDFKAKHPNAMDDEVMQHVVCSIKLPGPAGAMAIAGANKALKFLGKNPKASKKEVMQAVVNESNEIARNVSFEEDFD